MVGGEFLNVLWKLWYQGTIQMKYYEKKNKEYKRQTKMFASLANRKK